MRMQVTSRLSVRYHPRVGAIITVNISAFPEGHWGHELLLLLLSLRSTTTAAAAAAAVAAQFAAVSTTITYLSHLKATGGISTAALTSGRITSCSLIHSATAAGPLISFFSFGCRCCCCGGGGGGGC